jgi:ubiquinone/menaquinone biosynthesis C-methylase UbiE
LNDDKKTLDFADMAEKFDAWLPHIAPVGEALLNALNVCPGESVLDVAAGTGEPGLTLARRQLGEVTITGTDTAQSMVDVAQQKAAREGFSNIIFRCMPAESLDFPEASFDKLLCRFGLMFFGDPHMALSEMQRVLRSGGRVALSVWGAPEHNPTMSWYHRAFRGRIPDNLLPPLHKVTGFGDPLFLEKMMVDAGFRDVEISQREVVFRFPSFDDFWNLLEASAVLKTQFEALPKEEWPLIPTDIASWAEVHRAASGLEIPHGYLLATGVK